MVGVEGHGLLLHSVAGVCWSLFQLTWVEGQVNLVRATWKETQIHHK